MDISNNDFIPGARVSFPSETEVMNKPIFY